MIIGTTPTFTLTVTEDENLDFNEIKNIYFTISQNNTKVTKSTADITVIAKNKVQVTLSQEETLLFKYNSPAEIQLNWTYPGETRAATLIKIINVTKNLIREEIQ